jgi:hypothetical protein
MEKIKAMRVCPVALSPLQIRAQRRTGLVLASSATNAAEGAGLVYAPVWSVMNFVEAGRLKVILSEHELPPRPTNVSSPTIVCRRKAR